MVKANIGQKPVLSICVCIYHWQNRVFPNTRWLLYLRTFTWRHRKLPHVRSINNEINSTIDNHGLIWPFQYQLHVKLSTIHLGTTLYVNSKHVLSKPCEQFHCQLHSVSAYLYPTQHPRLTLKLSSAWNHSLNPGNIQPFHSVSLFPVQFVLSFSFSFHFIA